MAYFSVRRRRSAPRTASIFLDERGLSGLADGDGIAGLRSADKKKIMRTIAKLAHLGLSGGRFPLFEVVGHVRRALAAAALGRRPTRPLRDIDDWSDQAEIAYHEDCRVSRCH